MSYVRSELTEVNRIFRDIVKQVVFHGLKSSLDTNISLFFESEKKLSQSTHRRIKGKEKERLYQFNLLVNASKFYSQKHRSMALERRFDPLRISKMLVK